MSGPPRSTTATTRPMTSRAAVAWAVSAAIGFGLTSFLSKQATAAIDATQVGLLRYAVGLVFVVGVAAAGRVRAPVAWGLLTLRGLLGAGAGLLYYLSLNHVPVGTATFLNCTSPIFAAGFAALFLREFLRGQRLVAFALAFGGIAAVLVGQGSRLGGPLGWQAVALASGAIAGGAVVVTRAARRTDGAWTIFLFFAAFGVVFTAPFAIASWRWPVDAATTTALGWAIAAGLISLYAQLALTLSLGQVEAPVAAGIAELNFVTSLALGASFHGERFSAVSIAGAAITVLGVVWLAWASTRAAPPRR